MATHVCTDVSRGSRFDRMQLARDPRSPQVECPMEIDHRSLTPPNQRKIVLREREVVGEHVPIVGNVMMVANRKSLPTIG